MFGINLPISLFGETHLSLILYKRHQIVSIQEFESEEEVYIHYVYQCEVSTHTFSQ